MANKKPKELSDKLLMKTTKEYYRYHDGKKVVVADVISNKYNEDFKMLLVRLIDTNYNEEISSLAMFEHDGRGGYFVTEMEWCPRECEECLVNSFRNEFAY